MVLVTRMATSLRSSRDEGPMLFMFALISDVQYADRGKPIRKSFMSMLSLFCKKWVLIIGIRAPKKKHRLESRVTICQKEQFPNELLPFLWLNFFSSLLCHILDDGWNYLHTSQRFYRGAATGLQRAMDGFSAEVHDVAGQSADIGVFILQLGDLIDGFNAPEQSEQALEVVLRILNGLGCPVYHSLGNHELYNFRKEVNQPKLYMLAQNLFVILRSTHLYIQSNTCNR